MRSYNLKGHWYSIYQEMTKRSMTKTISKTTAVELIKSTKGRFFTVTFTKSNGNKRMINGNYKNTPSNGNLGYLRVYSMKDKGYRNVNSQTITGLTYNGMTYRVR
jgi:hypothetical protein